MVTQRSRLGSHCSQALGADGRPLLCLPPNWKGLQVEESFVPSSAESGPQYTGMPMLSVGLSGSGRCSIRSGHKTVEVINGPPTFNILGATYERDAAQRKGDAGTCLSISLPPSLVQRYLPEQAHRFDLKTDYGLSDNRLRSTILHLVYELKSGCPNGQIYAEGLSLAIIGWLHKHYALKHNPTKASQKLSARHKKHILDFIDASLDRELSIEALAATLCISPSHFSVLFRTTFGMPPHQFIIQKRVEKAAHLLRAEPDRSIMDISIETGFSSQAHLTNSFKRYMKLTPSSWKSGTGAP